MLAALFLAGKVEEELIELGPLVEKYFSSSKADEAERKRSKDTLVALEMKLLNLMRFQTVTCSPFRCLTGLVQSLHASLTIVAKEGDEVELTHSLQRLHDTAVRLVRKTLCSDAPFRFSPQQIALEALHTVILEPAEAPTGAESTDAPQGSREWLASLAERAPKMEEQLIAVRGLREGVAEVDDSAKQKLKLIDSRLKKLMKRVGVCIRGA